MILKATYKINNEAVKMLFEKFLQKLPAQKITSNSFEVSCEKTNLKLGELLHILNSMIDTRVDTIEVEYEVMSIKMHSVLGRAHG